MIKAIYVVVGFLAKVKYILCRNLSKFRFLEVMKFMVKIEKFTTAREHIHKVSERSHEKPRFYYQST